MKRHLGEGAPGEAAEGQAMHEQLIESHPKLARRQVWCRSCRCTERVENGLRDGWTKCCGAAMTIDPPEEGGEHH